MRSHGNNIEIRSGMPASQHRTSRSVDRDTDANMSSSSSLGHVGVQPEIGSLPNIIHTLLRREVESSDTLSKDKTTYLVDNSPPIVCALL